MIESYHSIDLVIEKKNFFWMNLFIVKDERERERENLISDFVKIVDDDDSDDDGISLNINFSFFH